MKKLIVYILLANFTIYCGCATIFSGSKNDLNLSSEPNGAKVLVNGQNEGKTPITLALKKGKEYVIEFVKEGYESKSVRITYGLGVGWLLLDILLTPLLVGVIVDAVTGNWNSLDLDTYKANLDPVNK